MFAKGHIIPNTPIAVNVWNTRDYPHVKLFFLTHFHPDHMCGLTSSWNYPIYASKISCKLLEEIIGINPMHLHCLEVGQPKKLHIDLEGKEILLVSVFDANHCPGAIMILLQGYFGNIFYTGDFRYKADLFEFSSLPDIDVLYLDNKYCSQDCSFPLHSDATEDILQLAHTCLQKSKAIYVGMDDLGKEDLLLKLAMETHTRIWISEKKKKTILEILELSDIVASEKTEAKFFVVPTIQFSSYNFDKWNTEMPICAILPTASYCGFKFQPYSRYENVHIKPLSNHSSFSELMNFVEKIHPCTIIPIIDKNFRGIFGIDISNRADMSVFDSLLDNRSLTCFAIPEAVKQAMDVWSENTKPSLPRKRKKLSSRHSTKKKSTNLSNSNDDPYNFTDESEEEEEEICRTSQLDYKWEVIHIPADEPKKLLYV